MSLPKVNATTMIVAWVAGMSLLFIPLAVQAESIGEKVLAGMIIMDTHAVLFLLMLRDEKEWKWQKNFYKSNDEK